jgi:hypothetical protein
MSIRGEQKVRIVLMCQRNPRGVRESQVIYLEERHHKLGKVFTCDTLEELVAEGYLSKTIEGPRRFKSVANKERRQIVRYKYVGEA